MSCPLYFLHFILRRKLSLLFQIRFWTHLYTTGSFLHTTPFNWIVYESYCQTFTKILKSLYLAWDSNPGFSSNKPTHYLLDHGDLHMLFMLSNLKIYHLLRINIYRGISQWSNRWCVGRRFSLGRFLAKSLRVKNKPAIKKFLKNLSLGVDVDL